MWRTVPLPSAFAQPAAFDFRTGIPDASLFPSTRWRRLIVRTLRTHVSGDAVYGDPAGHPALRDAIARHVGISRGVMASPDDVTVTSGTQQALDVIARVLLSKGDRIAVEDPGYTRRADFSDHLELIPSNTGLHLAATARVLSVERIERVARRAFARGVAVQTLSRFAASERARAGIVLGYGGIHTSNIERGLRILLKRFSSAAD